MVFNIMRKCIMTIAVIFLLLLTGFIIYKFLLPLVELSSADQQLVNAWLKKTPYVQTKTGEQPVLAAEWDNRKEYFNIYNIKGTHIGQITRPALIHGIQTHILPVVTIINPLPPIPVPPPMPAAPTPTPTPVLTPTPTPTPPPPIPTLTPTSTPQPSPSIPAHCGNKLADVDESDWNCGGTCLPCPPVPPYCDDLNYPSPWNVPCNQHLSCWDNNDCTSGNCDMSQAQPLPAGSPTGVIYNSYSQLRLLAGQTWIIPWQGRCA